MTEGHKTACTGTRASTTALAAHKLSADDAVLRIADGIG